MRFIRWALYGDNALQLVLLSPSPYVQDQLSLVYPVVHQRLKSFDSYKLSDDPRIVHHRLDYSIALCSTVPALS